MRATGPMTVRDDRGRTYYLVAYATESVRAALAGCEVGDWVRLRLHPAGSREDVCVATSLFPELSAGTRPA